MTLGIIDLPVPSRPYIRDGLLEVFIEFYKLFKDAINEEYGVIPRL